MFLRASDAVPAIGQHCNSISQHYNTAIEHSDDMCLSQEVIELLLGAGARKNALNEHIAD